MKNLSILAQRRSAKSLAQSDAMENQMSGLYEINEQTIADARKSGAAYWDRNKPYNATRNDLERLARSCGWHDADNVAWLEGFYEAKDRSMWFATRSRTGLY
jgi:hypothetical protein